jgi:hypothetical protein
LLIERLFDAISTLSPLGVSLSIMCSIERVFDWLRRKLSVAGDTHDVEQMQTAQVEPASFPGGTP